MSETPSILVGRYELGEVIGRGGMAEVHLGRDLRLGRSVAIKILRADLARDPAFQARFRREAQSAASLNHPAIVAVYDTGEETVSNISVPFIVMEYVEGSTLRDLLASGKRLLPVRAMEVTASVLTALEYSHRQGIVHRDIKPGNVMLTNDGRVKVMDFGIARALADTGAMTQTAAVMGTAQYLSPEQARGEQVDIRSDLYSTGCLLYELLTGRPPFTGDSPVSVAYQHVREEPMPPSSVDREVPATADAVTLKALAKDRDQRYQTAAEFRADLENVIRGGEPTTAYGTAAATMTTAPPVAAAAATTALPTYTGPATPRSGAATMVSESRGYTSAPPPDGDKGGMGPVLLLGAIAALAVALVVGWFVFSDRESKPGGGVGASSTNTQQPTSSNGTTAQTVTVANYVGQTLTQARSAIQQAGLALNTLDYRESTTTKAGEVLEQSLTPNSQVARGTKITLTVAKAPAEKKIPDVEGKSLAAAMRLLEAEGFKLVSKDSKDSAEKKDTVLSISPNAGETADPATTRITLTYATGKNVIPDNLVQQTYLGVKQTLEQAGFQVAPMPSVTTDSTQNNMVFQVTPQSGQTAEVGSTVTVYYHQIPGSQNPSPPTTTSTTTSIPVDPNNPNYVP